MNEVPQSGWMVGAWLAPTSPYLSPPTPVATEAQRIVREGIAALGCGCGMVPGFTSRPRGGAWPASLPKSVINNASVKPLYWALYFTLPGLMLMCGRGRLPSFCHIWSPSCPRVVRNSRGQQFTIRSRSSDP